MSVTLPETRDQTAATIYQDWLDRIAVALWASDFETVAAAMHYPHMMQTEDGEVWFHDPEQTIQGARDFRRYLASMGAQAYMRLCTQAHFTHENKGILGNHTTYVIRGGTYVIAPFTNEMTLTCRDGKWLGAGTRAACTNHECTILSPAQLRQQHLTAGQASITKDPRS